MMENAVTAKNIYGDMLALRDVTWIKKMECVNLLIFSKANPLAMLSRSEFSNSMSLLLSELLKHCDCSTKILSQMMLVLEKEQRRRANSD